MDGRRFSVMMRDHRSNSAAVRAALDPDADNPDAVKVIETAAQRLGSKLGL